MIIFLFIYGILVQYCSFNMVESYNFSFSSFDSQICQNGGGLICMGSVNTDNDSINITPTTDQNVQKSDTRQVGRVLFHRSIVAWPTTFCTFFTIKILTDPNSIGYGDGMSFIIAQDDKPSPPDSFGSFIGILDPYTQGGVLRQLAVEFDTHKNENDPDGNHIAVDTISVSDPVAVRSLAGAGGINLTSGREISVKIHYDGWSKILDVSVAYSGDPLISVLTQKIVMENTVPEQVYVGFTASTGYLHETHQILNWNFTSEALPPDSLKQGNKKDDKIKVALLVVVPALVGLLLVAAMIFVEDRRRRRNERNGKDDIEILTRNAANIPRIFTFRQLSKCTRNFSKENLLGKGGFGSVYKGILSDPAKTVAVKKINPTSKQGEKEYLAEICTIGRLRHKNLLQLLGWCHNRDQLLLVYEYMPNGSLDRFIGRQFLDWKTRYDVLTGLASALVYLHEECGSPVVHRDIKPNNVMLDSDFKAHLGDFGLARLLQNDTAITTMAAGTPGYLAPEVSYIGRATPESDVYSFGMVVLEVVCGKRSRGMMEEENSLVEGVWGMHEKGIMVKCVDSMLEGNYDEEQVKRALVIGLACLHPDYNCRPNMRKVAQIFMSPNEPLLKLPASRPNTICLSLHSSRASTTTDIGSGAGVGVGSMGSLPDELTVMYEE